MMLHWTCTSIIGVQISSDQEFDVPSLQYNSYFAGMHQNKTKQNKIKQCIGYRIKKNLIPNPVFKNMHLK